MSISPYASIPDGLYVRVLEKLRELEQTHDITVLFAVENGSRLTGLSHDDSDCDVRFVYRYNRTALNTTTGRDMVGCRETIEGISDDKMIDWQGWCIDKAIHGMKSSNPSIIEWLYSDIVYITADDGLFLKECRQIMSKMHSIKSLYYHYLNMAKKNWLEFIKDKAVVIYKKYLYVLRPLFMLVYIQSSMYDELKEQNPIINDFNKLLEFVRLYSKIDDNNSAYSLNPRVEIEISRLVEIKKMDKHYEGEPLLRLNTWIDRFFAFEDEKREDTDKTEKIVFQALRNVREKLCNELKKIDALSIRNEYISRNDYLSLFSQYTMFIWLIQHPGKHSGEAPQNIGNILKEIDIDNDLSEWIHNIITTKGDECDKSQNSSDSKIESTRKKYTYMIVDHIKMFFETLREDTLSPEAFESFDSVLSWLNETRLELDGGKSILRDDAIDNLFQSYMSTYWLIKSGQNGRNVPRDVFSDRDISKIIPQLVINTGKQLALDLRPKYMVKVVKSYHELIHDDVSKYYSYVDNITAKYAQKKEIDKKAMFKGTFKTIDPFVFLDLLERHTSKH